MATPHTRTSRLHPLGGLALTFLLFLAPGCQTKTPTLVTPAPSASHSASPSVQDTPLVPLNSLTYEEITARYQSPVDPAQNGWPELLKFLEGGEGDDSSGIDKAEALDLEQAADAKLFDQSILPVLASAFTKPAVTGAPPLISGKDPINPYYRDLRALCDLLTKRADQLQSAGDKEQAMKLIGLPLSLAQALQSRPETVSVNDFSSKFAAASLATIADWASTNVLSIQQLEQLSALLADKRPNYQHLALTISVDFAQLENSLDDQQVRTETLGLGLSDAATISTWKQELRTLRGEAEKLYQLTPIDAQTFNNAVMKLAGPIQGIVIDYPNIAAMQKRSFASYLATELALTLERHRLSEEKEPLSAEQVFQRTFSSDLTTQQIAQALLEVRLGATPSSFTIVGQSGMFTLLSPDPNVIFYQRL